MPTRVAWAGAVLLVLTSGTAARQPQPLEAGDWTLSSAKQGAYGFEATGRATDASGATITVRSVADASSTYASVSSRVSAEALHGRRVTVSGELQTRSATGGASLWLRIDQGRTALLLDDGTLQAVHGDADWTRRSMSLGVPAEATAVAFGVLLMGSGAVSARGLRLDVIAPANVHAPLAGPAREVLDAAVSITKQKSLRRNDVAWDVVESRARAFAAGAETSADVYPAIRYLLAQLGDHHSFLMPPAQMTQLLTGGGETPSLEVRALPEQVGYIRMPGYSGAEPAAMRTYATRTHEALAGTIASASCGWVVDLRPDTGGNMWPMLAGLKPFLGTSGLGTV